MINAWITLTKGEVVEKNGQTMEVGRKFLCEMAEIDLDKPFIMIKKIKKDGGTSAHIIPTRLIETIDINE